jgi:ABC-type dipeptide/oligopeptide/nickel transport system permease subunit
VKRLIDIALAVPFFALLLLVAVFVATGIDPFKGQNHDGRWFGLVLLSLVCGVAYGVRNDNGSLDRGIW